MYTTFDLVTWYLLRFLICKSRVLFIALPTAKNPISDHAFGQLLPKNMLNSDRMGITKGFICFIVSSSHSSIFPHQHILQISHPQRKTRYILQAQHLLSLLTEPLKPPDAIRRFCSSVKNCISITTKCSAMPWKGDTSTGYTAATILSHP